jgi:hypothetical protein
MRPLASLNLKAGVVVLDVKRAPDSWPVYLTVRQASGIHSAPQAGLIGAECLQAVECLPIAKECPLLLSAQRFYSLSNACTLIEFRDPNHKVDINRAPLQTRRLW